jgi:N4-(beta-N-acetylglucosaminyl)-L-asparaginase
MKPKHNNQNRRTFLRKSALAGALTLMGVGGWRPNQSRADQRSSNPLGLGAQDFVPTVALSTWRFGLKANAEAWSVLSKGGKSLDAVEAGVRVVEADPQERSVGYGGRPDRDGHVTLDACIMDELGNAGSVAFLQHIMHPISVARAVMERTPHIMLCGSGALEFALREGFKKQNLLTAESEAEWRRWMKDARYTPVVNIENHDTIGMLVRDETGRLSGACTTSGMAWKLHGRVGDSPLIGAGLYVDGQVGAATATGHGEEVIRIAGSHLVVELMRQGRSADEACREAVNRAQAMFVRRGRDLRDTQIGFLAMRADGQAGAFALRSGFSYARTLVGGHTELLDAPFLLN